MARRKYTSRSAGRPGRPSPRPADPDDERLDDEEETALLILLAHAHGDRWRIARLPGGVPQWYVEVDGKPRGVMTSWEILREVADVFEFG